MPYPLLGLHHVTATVDQAQPDIDFCVDALGLRLVKRTVNFDNHHVYHFYYGDERGTPGTIWTTFPYHGRGVRAGTKGAGQVTVSSFSVPAGSLGFWKKRLTDRGIAVTSEEARFGEASLTVTDPSGLSIALVATAKDAREGRATDGVDAAHAVRGLHSVSMTTHSPADTLRFMSEVLGFEVVNEMDNRTRIAVNGGGPGAQIDVVFDPVAPSAVNGLGTVHHVALAIADSDQQRRLRGDLLRRGCTVTEVLDRQYFQSIYFREPGGVLLEVATISPGFTVDEPLEELGRHLKLPPWEEGNRASIEAGLPPIVVRSTRSDEGGTGSLRAS